MSGRFVLFLIGLWERISWRFYKLLDTDVYPALLTKTAGVEAGPNIRLEGRPRIELSEGSKIVLGEDITLRSRNCFNHLTFSGPVTLIADGKDSRLEIGPRASLGGVCIHADKLISIGSDCLMGANVQVFDCPGHAPCFDSLEDRAESNGDSKPVYIEDYVWLGSNVIVLPGTRLGYGSIVASGSVVSGRFPSYSIIMGNPAKLVIRRKPPESDPDKS